MITEYEASEFISMIILNEKRNGNNKVQLPFDDIYNLARQIERENSSIRINLSSDSIQSYFCRIPKTIYVRNNILYVDSINDAYSFLRHYGNEDSFIRIKYSKNN